MFTKHTGSLSECQQHVRLFSTLLYGEGPSFQQGRTQSNTLAALERADDQIVTVLDQNVTIVLRQNCS